MSCRQKQPGKKKIRVVTRSPAQSLPCLTHRGPELCLLWWKIFSGTDLLLNVIKLTALPCEWKRRMDLQCDVNILDPARSLFGYLHWTSFSESQQRPGPERGRPAVARDKNNDKSTSLDFKRIVLVSFHLLQKSQWNFCGSAGRYKMEMSFMVLAELEVIFKMQPLVWNDSWHRNTCAKCSGRWKSIKADSLVM